LPANFQGGTRKLGGDIYNLYARDASSATPNQAGFPLHLLESDELYHYYGGDGPIIIYEFDLNTTTVKEISVGNSVPGRDVPQ
jgi:hypothetical protein